MNKHMYVFMYACVNICVCVREQMLEGRRQLESQDMVSDQCWGENITVNEHLFLCERSNGREEVLGAGSF